jgi:hypothetical protein
VDRQFLQRHDNRSTIHINDEYEVQDLLHGMLRANFFNVVEEDYTPRNAESSSRVDFLLKNEKIVVEVGLSAEYIFYDKAINATL